MHGEWPIIGLGARDAWIWLREHGRWGDRPRRHDRESMIGRGQGHRASVFPIWPRRLRCVQ